MTPIWRFEFLGGLRARRDNEVITRFRTQKTASLLAYLALKPGPQSREVLVGLLWPDSEPEAARNSLSAALSSLRRQLEDGAVDGAVVIADRASVGFNTATFTTDVADFEATLRQAEKTGDDATRIELLAQAVELYGGPFLPGFYDEWAISQARSCEEQFIEALSDLFDLLEEAGQWERALLLARRGLNLYPNHENWHLALIRAYRAQGQSEALLRQHDELKTVLAREGRQPPDAAVRMADEATQRLQSGASQPTSIPIQNNGHVAAPATPSVAETALTSGVASPQIAPPRPTGGNRLPVKLTRFFGRGNEIEQLHRRLVDDGVRLLTLTGSGGSGKTRLAVEAARGLLAHWQDAVWFVSLADITDAAFIFPAIRDALKLPAVPNVSPQDQLDEALSSGPALLLLDNFEQLVEEGAACVQELLEQLPTLTILVTSRQVLGLPGEREFPVLPLPVPDEDAAAAELKEYSSTALFIDRAQATRVDFRVDERNGPAVAAICRRLEGIPLAIELAAARSLVLSPTQMLDKLKDRLDLLSTRQRGIPERHRTLRAAIEWSYGLLSVELQRFFVHLSVFRGGWTIEAAEAVCEEPDALDFLTRLRECSLVVTEQGENGCDIRFRMLETLREYATSQLATPDRMELETRYAAYCVDFTEGAEPHLHGPEQAVWLERIECEQDNLRAVLTWTMDNDPHTALRLAAALSPFWETRGHYAEGRNWLERALAKTASDEDAQEDPQRARALSSAGWLAYYAGDYIPSRAQLEEGLAIAHRSGDRQGAVQALAGLAANDALEHNFKTMEAHINEALELIRSMETQEERARVIPALSMMGLVSLQGTDFTAALAINAEVMALARSSGDMVSLARGLLNQGTLANIRGDFTTARAYLNESVALFREYNEPFSGGYALWNLGETARFEGDFGAARPCYREAMEICIVSKVPIGFPYLFESYGQMAVAEGKMAQAARILGAAAARRAEGHMPMPPFIAPAIERAVAQVRAALGDTEFEQAWQSGAALSTEDAINEALQDD